ncbi:MAG TPA: FkbM family methyltransferase [Stellaceae bacterium]|jgi:FkbM family methyltransferase|nr:FkbM family methyltransferase [Stellaceae bacterium]
MSDTANPNDRLILDQPPLRIKRCRRGPMMYFPADLYVGRSLDLYGEFSEGEVELFTQIVKPGMLVVDVGANIGAHTVFFAKTVGPEGRVLAVEPQRILYQILCANLALNLIGNTFVRQAGLGSAPGSIQVPPINYAGSFNFGGVSLGNFTEGEQVPVITLDSLALPACHVLKIDVEGMESEVLQGGRDTLARHRPLLYVENDRPEKSAALIALLFELDYRLFWHLPPLFHADNFAGHAENVFSTIVSANMIGVPRSIEQSVQGFREITSPDDKWQG